MEGHAASRHSLAHEEKLSLLEDRSTSDAGSDGSHLDFTSRFRNLASTYPPSSKLDQKIPDASTLARGVLRAFFSIPWRLLALRGLIFLVPSFLQSTITGEKRRQERLHPTAYLDGMRGLAALFVYFCHYTYQAFVIAEGWGSRETNYHWLKLPLVRLWYQGPPMVCVFFVISGYALSLKPLKLMRSRSFGDLAATMSSLAFRRGIRLYLPTAISTLLVVFLLRMGAYEATREFANDRAYMKNIVEPHAPRLDTTYEQLRSWARDMFYFVYVFGWDKYGGNVVNLDVHLWTIPVEFRCSMYLFLVLIAIARLRTWIRIVVLTGIMVFTYLNTHWELVLFYCGMMIAEFDLIRGAHNQHVSSPSPGPILGSPTVQEKSLANPIVRKLKTAWWAAFSLLALYLMCQPDAFGDVTPGWIYLSSLIPKWWYEEQYRYWQSIGSILFVYAVCHSPVWQRFFNTSVVQYFGKISYALYLMHGPVMHTAGYMIERWAYGLTGVDGYWYNGGFMLGFVFAVPTVVWAADIFWRVVDIPTVRFAKWVEEKCIAKTA